MAQENVIDECGFVGAHVVTEKNDPRLGVLAQHSGDEAIRGGKIRVPPLENHGVWVEAFNVFERSSPGERIHGVENKIGWRTNDVFR
jgi:hypothetical protein